MPKIKLNFRFHNPNTAEKTAEYIAALFFEANKMKIEHILQENIRQIKCTVANSQPKVS